MIKLPPFWKLRREAARPFWQLFLLGPNLASYCFGALYYDLFQSRKVRVFEGALPPGSRTAIYLIFPNSGLKGSHLHSLRYLADNGYATIVVSNLPLSPADQKVLCDNCWVFLQRPNYGYDFGGYREGVRYLGSRINGLDRLVIVNDSTWFPVDNNNWLDQAEKLGVDFAAAASNYGTPHPDISDFRNIKWEYKTTHRNFHYCSFAFLFSPRLVRDKGFQRFWRWFPMTNDKTRTVRRGEIGLSQWIIRRGFSHAATGNVQNLDRELAALSDERLFEVAENIIIPEDRRLGRIKQELFANGKPTRAELIGLILTTVARQGASYVLADMAIHEREFAFLKKSPVWLDEEASNITIKLASAFPSEEGAIIVKEALEIRARRAPGFSDAELTMPDRFDMDGPNDML